MGQSVATCPAGTVVVGGGFTSQSIRNSVLQAARLSSTTYGVAAGNEFHEDNAIQAQAICASGSAAAARSAGTPSTSRAEFDDLVAAYRAAAAADSRR